MFFYRHLASNIFLSEFLSVLFFSIIVLAYALKALHIDGWLSANDNPCPEAGVISVVLSEIRRSMFEKGVSGIG